MAKRITERERLLSYALKATDEQLREAIETLQTVLKSRAPKEKERKKKVGTTSTAAPISISGTIGAKDVAETQRRIAEAAAAG